VLAIETATEACSAALWEDAVISVRYRVAPRQHAELILPMVEEVLAEAGWSRTSLGAVAFGRGPGSFTGVRLAASVTQGIAFGLDVPVARVSTLQAMARRAWREQAAERVLVAIDARMREVYWGAFGVDAAGSVVAQCEECVLAPAEVPLPESGTWTGVGTGWGSYLEQLAGHVGALLGDVDDALLPSAEDIAVLGGEQLRRGEGVAPEEAIPVYLRDNVAVKPG
jgi:tRNA threonylcarbamoyladenosine biosynthesis protein TsaB